MLPCEGRRGTSVMLRVLTETLWRPMFQRLSSRKGSYSQTSNLMHRSVCYRVYRSRSLTTAFRKTVRRMAEAFGPLESFRALTTDDTGEDAYPLGHDATRTPGMDAGVWEIKWEHRDDCVTALNVCPDFPLPIAEPYRENLCNLIFRLFVEFIT